jgi:hypothetical protein
MESDLLELLTQTITIESVASRDGYGKPAYGPARTYRARVVGKIRMVRDANGEERVSSATVHVDATDIVPTDRITLPDGSQPLVLSVGSYPDERGAHHQVIYCV